VQLGCDYFDKSFRAVQLQSGGFTRSSLNPDLSPLPYARHFQRDPAIATLAVPKYRKFVS